MKTKKLSALLLTLVMAISLVACGGNDNSADVYDILNHEPQSYKSLIKTLEEEYGYSHKNAVKAADSCDVNWNEMAVSHAIEYLSASDVETLTAELEENGFTHEQAVYGAERCDSDVKMAVWTQLRNDALSYDSLLETLQESYGFSHEESVEALDGCKIDWNEMAVKAALMYIEWSPETQDELIEDLEYYRFTHEQAVYAVENAGIDWNEVAARSGSEYLDIMDMDEEELREQLEYTGFTPEQAAYGAKHAKKSK